MTTHIFGRRPFDDYHKKIIKICEEIIPHYLNSYSIYYHGGWSILNYPIIPNPLELKPGVAATIENDTSEYIVIMSSDRLSDLDFVEPIGHFLPDLYHLKRLNKKIILITSVFNAKQDFPDIDYITFVYAGGDHMFGMETYPKLTPVRNKNFDTNQWWCSLSMRDRPHRVLTACALLGNGLGLELNKTGLLKIDAENYNKIPRWTDIDPTLIQSATVDQSDILELGFSRLKNHEHFGQPLVKTYYPKDGPGAVVDFFKSLNNAVNFSSSLKPIYQNTFVEIVNETTFFNKGIFVTEKYQNSIYGYNLPIIIGNAGVVAYLRSRGFDMYDDVIDHSYDLIEDPVQRIFSAIDLNRQLLTDRQYAQSQWRSMLPRMDRNLAFCRNMYDHYFDMFKQNLVKALESLPRS
jgi:hypothetical protein